MDLRHPFLVVCLLVASLATAQTGAPPGNYVVTQIAAGATAYGMNNSGQVVGYSADRAFLWTPATSNASVGSLVDLGGLPVAGTPGNSAVGINDRGQVVGNTANLSTSYLQAFLWSPDTPNGTSGTLVAFAGSAENNTGFEARAINGYGQIIGYAGGTYIWTPSVPNGATGTLDFDNRLQYTGAINDFGQAVINSPYLPSQPSLFTPATANGSVGTVTPVSGLAGAVSQRLIAINSSGTILGESCFNANQVQCSSPGTGFLWTPSSPNGAVGTAAAIPLPAGFTDISPMALNSSAQVVGQLQVSAGGPPFLYTAGAVYDLSILNAQLAGGIATSINDHGQIVINANGAVYLLTPSSPSSPAPGEVPVTITSNVTSQMFMVSGSGCHPGGYTTPQPLEWIPGSACTVTFVSPHSSQIGTRYLWNAWQDGVATNPRTFVAPAQASTYTGTFTTQYFVTALANVPSAGTVSGGGWYNAGDQATLTATPASGYRLVSWTGAPSSLAPGSPSFTVTITAPLTVTANFGPRSVPPPGTYTITQIAAGAAAASGKPVNNYGQVVGARLPSAIAFLWTPNNLGTSNGTLGSSVDLPIIGAAGINDRGQVISGVSLWSPDAVNGTSGTVAALPGSAAAAVNSFGQVTGYYGNGSTFFLWTPAAANGPTGTFITDNRLGGAAINDFGQVAGSTSLFTPSVQHGSSGAYTQISGAGQLIAINNSGAILGTTCPVDYDGCSSYHGYLWTPSSPNGVVGTVTELLPPAGFVSLQPAALNSAGQVVGSLDLADGSVTPFLYRDGAFYDLSALGDQLRGGIPRGINDRGQIVITTGGLPFTAASTVYLLTPSVSYPTYMLPPDGSGSSQTFRFGFRDTTSWADIGTVDILINSALDGRHACYIAYNPQLNTVYLVNDDGMSLLPGLTLNGSGAVTNSQCAVNTSGSSVDGNTQFLNLNLNLSFTPGFAGNKVVYTAARNVAGDGYGWEVMGVWNVPGGPAASVAPAAFTPLSSSNSGYTFTFTFSDNKGWQDFGVVDILINGSLDGRQACYVAYSRPSATLYLFNDAGTGLLPGLALNGSGSLVNSQCTVGGAGSSVTAGGNALALTLNFSFSPAFAGIKVFYLAARDSQDANNSGWQPMGTWGVQ